MNAKRMRSEFKRNRELHRQYAHCVSCYYDDVLFFEPNAIYEITASEGIARLFRFLDGDRITGRAWFARHFEGLKRFAKKR